MKKSLHKFIELERQVASDKGPFELFALLLREDSDQWDLVVAAPWLNSGDQRSWDEITAAVQAGLGEAELHELGRIVIFDMNHETLGEILSVAPSSMGVVNLQHFSFSGLEIERGYFIGGRRKQGGAGAVAPRGQVA